MDKVKEKIKKGFDPQIDILHGGDGLADWMQYTITIMMFATLGGVLWLLFHPVLDLDETHRDLLNILLGSFIASFGKVIDFWFKLFLILIFIDIFYIYVLWVVFKL